MVDWVILREAGRLEAVFLKSLLTSAGIPVRLQGEALGQLYGLNTGPLGQVRILVPVDRAKEVEGILKARIEKGLEDAEETGKSP